MKTNQKSTKTTAQTATTSGKSSPAKNTLTIEKLSYSYQNGERIQKVLDNINAKFEAGKIYAIVGESGSGKTTFLSLISALDKLQEGDVRYNS